MKIDPTAADCQADGPKILAASAQRMRNGRVLQA